MSSTIATFVTVIIILHQALSFHMKMTPQIYTEESTGVVEMACVMDTLDYCLQKKVMQMELSKDGETTIAFVKIEPGVRYGTVDHKKYEALGVVDNHGNTTFLNVTLVAPNNDDTGRYTCLMLFVDKLGKFVEETDSKNLTVEIFNVHSSLKRLQHDLALKDRDIADMKTQLNNATNKLMDQVANLTVANRALTQKMADKDTVAGVVDRVSSLEAKAWNQSEELANRVTRLDVMTWNLSQGLDELKNQSQQLTNGLTDLSDNVTYSVMFSASLTPDVDLTNGQTVVFDNVILNEGKAYDGSTGIFTSPRKGVYTFHVTLFTRGSNRYVQAHVKVDDAIMATLYGIDKDYFEQTSTSFVAHLDKGSKVKVEAYSYSKTQLLGHPTYKYCLFSGYLERSD